MGQEDCEKWTAAAHLQPAISKSDRLLGSLQTVGQPPTCSGLQASHGTPQDIITRLNKALVEGVKSDAITSVYNNATLESFTTTPQGLAEFQRSETDTWGRVIKAAGIQPE
ncbi:tripartite tricarboxylate transporter substrate-binding protein [Ottowia caeni]|uniref:tripartite tricarboxylate transporter substrate-binding protein n=1 Tax=Ottowia caeni TaxID=2870339 RepID=UPI001E523E81|nr:hypothetical protein [Ottowia caeni]